MAFDVEPSRLRRYQRNACELVSGARLRDRFGTAGSTALGAEIREQIDRLLDEWVSGKITDREALERVFVLREAVQRARLSAMQRPIESLVNAMLNYLEDVISTPAYGQRDEELAADSSCSLRVFSP